MRLPVGSTATPRGGGSSSSRPAARRRGRGPARRSAQRELREEAGLEAAEWTAPVLDVPLAGHLRRGPPLLPRPRPERGRARRLRAEHEEADMRGRSGCRSPSCSTPSVAGAVRTRRWRSRSWPPGARGLAPASRSRRRHDEWRGRRRRESREGRRPQGSQEPRVPGGDHPDRGARADRARARGVHRAGAPASGRRSPTRSTSRPARRSLGPADEVWGTRGHGAQGQGAGRRGVPPDARGPDALHLPAPGRRQAADRGAAQAQGHRDRLRDRAAALGRAAAALPDVGGRRLPGAPGRRATR